MAIETIDFDEYGARLRRAATAQHGDGALYSHSTQIGRDPDVGA
jgi:hypothetical protein